MNESTELASRISRLGASFIDGFLSLAVVYLVMSMFGMLETLADPQNITFGFQIMLAIMGFGIYLGIHGYTLATRGQSIGKRLFEIQIVSIHTNKMFSLTHVAAYRILPLQILGLIPFLGTIVILADTLFIFRDDRRCIHDILCGSKVVNYTDSATQTEQA